MTAKSSSSRASDTKIDRDSLTKAFDEASRTATRSSLLGMLGFGLALAMGALLARENGFLAAGYGLDMILFAGGLCGGLVFTVMAIRASRMARQCRLRLDELNEPKANGARKGTRNTAKRRPPPERG